MPCLKIMKWYHFFLIVLFLVLAMLIATQTKIYRFTYSFSSSFFSTKKSYKVLYIILQRLFVSSTVFSWTSFQINGHWSLSFTGVALWSTTVQMHQNTTVYSITSLLMDCWHSSHLESFLFLFNAYSATINIHNKILSIYFWRIGVPKVDKTHFSMKSSCYSLLVALGWDEDPPKWSRVDSELLAGAHHPKGETICLLKSAPSGHSGQMTGLLVHHRTLVPNHLPHVPQWSSLSCVSVTPSFTESQGHQPCDTSRGWCTERAHDSEPAVPTESRSQESEGSSAAVGMGCSVLCRASQPLGPKAWWSEVELTS